MLSVHKMFFKQAILIVSLLLSNVVYASNLLEKINSVLYATGIHTVEDYRGISIYIPTDEMFMRIPAQDPRIDPHYMITLDSVVNVLQNYVQNRELEITGHTDNLWTSVEEKLVSQRYAEAVAEYMVSRGVQGQRIIKISGVGSAQPGGNNRFAQGRKMNRRVEILIVPPHDIEIVKEKPPAVVPEPLYDK